MHDGDREGGERSPLGDLVELKRVKAPAVDLREHTEHLLMVHVQASIGVGRWQLECKP